MRLICIALLSFFLLIGCVKSSTSNLPVNSSSTPTSDGISSQQVINIADIYNLKSGNLLYFEGPYDIEWYWYLSNKTQSDATTSLFFKTINGDLSGTLSISERSSAHKIIITNKSIFFDNNEVLREPITVGNSWLSQWGAKYDTPQGTANVSINKIVNDFIFVEATIDNLKDFKIGHYREVSIFKIGYGLVAYQYTSKIAETDKYDFYIKLSTFADKPINEIEWYVPWYQRSDKDKLSSFDELFDLFEN